MILNQTNTGFACPRDVESLKSRIPDGSLMTYIPVYAFTLAKVLDRLEALEAFEKQVVAASSRFQEGAGKCHKQ